jgi:drug/metabolite transporter (DMT)-like permease
MSCTRLFVLTAFAMIPLAANSWLCRAALRDTAIDPASFTSLRLISGALMLWILVWLTGQARRGHGSWPSAIALFGYAALFSYAYLSLTAATGALLLFGAVQVTMIGLGLRSGERLDLVQVIGVALAFTGLVGLLWPGWSAPAPVGGAMMIGAGVAWGVYSFRGKGAGDPIRVNAGNFLLTIPLTLGLSLLSFDRTSIDPLGVGYAVASGAFTSALGYALWYRLVPLLRATSAATVQLSVPVIVAVGGVLFLAEPITLRLLLASGAVLGGIALVIWERGRIDRGPRLDATGPRGR